MENKTIHMNCRVIASEYTESISSYEINWVVRLLISSLFFSSYLSLSLYFHFNIPLSQSLSSALPFFSKGNMVYAMSGLGACILKIEISLSSEMGPSPLSRISSSIGDIFFCSLLVNFHYISLF